MKRPRIEKPRSEIVGRQPFLLRQVPERAVLIFAVPVPASCRRGIARTDQGSGLPGDDEVAQVRWEVCACVYDPAHRLGVGGRWGEEAGAEG